MVDYTSLSLTVNSELYDTLTTGDDGVKFIYKKVSKYWTRRLVGNYHQYNVNLPMVEDEYLMPYGIDKIVLINGSRRTTMKWTKLTVAKAPDGSNMFVLHIKSL